MINRNEADKRSKIVKTLAHPARIMMLEYLKSGEKTFGQIFDLFKLDKSTVSKHLAVLKSVNIISLTKQGRDTIYKLEVPCITDFFGCVSAVQNKTSASRDI